MENSWSQMPYILVMTRQKIALIACVKEKQLRPCAAAEMYISSDFKSWMDYAESWGASQIYILSGKYGLLELEEKIAPYDVNLNIAASQERKRWARGVIEQLKSKASLREDYFLVLANSNYSEYIIPQLKHYSMPLKID